MTAECTTADCGNWSELYLCGRCVDDLQQWIDQIPLLLPELDVTIAKQDVTRPANMGGSGGGKPGSAAPTNLDASRIKANLAGVSPRAADYAPDQYAAGMAELITEWVTKAELLISGPQAEFVNLAAIRERVENIAPAMPTRTLLPWLRTNASITITSQNIRDWARRGKLTPVDREPSPTYNPHDVLNAWHETRRENNGANVA